MKPIRIFVSSVPKEWELALAAATAICEMYNY